MVNKNSGCGCRMWGCVGVRIRSGSRSGFGCVGVKIRGKNVVIEHDKEQAKTCGTDLRRYWGAHGMVLGRNPEFFGEIRMGDTSSNK